MTTKTASKPRATRRSGATRVFLETSRTGPLPSTITKSSCDFKIWRGKIVSGNAQSRIKMVRIGFAGAALDQVVEYFSFTTKEIAGVLGVSVSTFERRIKKNEVLTVPETERLARITLVENEAAEVFGNSEKAKLWLKTKNRALNEEPINFLDTDIGTNEVRKVLSSIAHGGAV